MMIKVNKILLGKDIIHFLHIGKTAGTAIQSALSSKRVFFGKTVTIIYRPHKTKFKDIPHGEKVFFVVRDPLSRFKSGFYSRFRKGMPRMNSPWSDDENEAFGRFSTPNDLGEALSSDDYTLRTSAQKALHSIGHVNTSYWDWFGNEQYLKERTRDIVMVLCQEELNEDFEVLKKHLGLHDRIQLPTDEISMHKNPDYLDKSLSTVAVENLKKWYSDEYTFLKVLRKNGLITRVYQ